MQCIRALMWQYVNITGVAHETGKNKHKHLPGGPFRGKLLHKYSFRAQDPGGSTEAGSAVSTETHKERERGGGGTRARHQPGKGAVGTPEHTDETFTPIEPSGS